MNCLGCGQKTEEMVCNSECEQLLRKKINEQIKLQENKEPKIINRISGFRKKIKSKMEEKK